MKIFFDTSVLIATFVEAHPKHERSLAWFKKAKSEKNSLVVSAHSIAECFSVLTSMPLNPKISSEIALGIIKENLTNSVEIVDLNYIDYFEVINQLSELGIMGGVVYDGLLIKAASKAGVDKILTLNSKDFNRLWLNKELIISV